MRTRNHGKSFVVTVSRREVADFARRWPCFGPVRPLRFTFDEKGDLVGLDGDSGMDGAGVSALAEDAKRYGWARRGA